MRLTKKHFEQIINESIQSVLNEDTEDLYTFINGCQAFELMDAFKKVYGDDKLQEMLGVRDVTQYIVDVVEEEGEEKKSEFLGLISNANEELTDVISQDKKTGKWRIRGYHGYWKSRYETKEKAENALKAYHASESEEVFEAVKQFVKINPSITGYHFVEDVDCLDFCEHNRQNLVCVFNDNDIYSLSSLAGVFASTGSGYSQAKELARKVSKGHVCFAEVYKCRDGVCLEIALS